MFKKITVVGLGYIGLPTAALIASKGMLVYGYDVKQSLVDTINQGRIHIIEPDLEGLVLNVVSKKILTASLEVKSSDAFLIAVPTPVNKDNSPDISFVVSATEKVIPALKPNDLFVIESTCPVGTTQKMADLIFSKRPELKGKIFIAYCPERVLPGRVLYELENNDRSIGGIDDISTEKAMEFYLTFVRGSLFKTNSKTAEMCKLIENSYRDVNIAFANELSMICDDEGINVWDLIELANKHPRVKILKPGSGVGGHCIAVDPWFIVSSFPEKARLIKAGRLVNNNKAEWVVKKVLSIASQYKAKNKKDPVIACMGLAFKPDIDDLRESPALSITKELMNAKTKVIAVEPNISSYSGIDVVDIHNAVAAADIFVFLVSHRQFNDLTLPESKIVLDFCGIRGKA